EFFDLLADPPPAHFRALCFLGKKSEPLILDREARGKPVELSEDRLRLQAPLRLPIPLESEARLDAPEAGLLF
ncbi:MAG: hypothetical protein V3V56_05110, partial [bacterium]